MMAVIMSSFSKSMAAKCHLPKFGKSNLLVTELAHCIYSSAATSAAYSTLTSPPPQILIGTKHLKHLNLSHNILNDVRK